MEGDSDDKNDNNVNGRTMMITMVLLMMTITNTKPMITKMSRIVIMLMIKTGGRVGGGAG